MYLSPCSSLAVAVIFTLSPPSKVAYKTVHYKGIIGEIIQPSLGPDCLQCHDSRAKNLANKFSTNFELVNIIVLLAIGAAFFEHRSK